MAVIISHSGGDVKARVACKMDVISFGPDLVTLEHVKNAYIKHTLDRMDGDKPAAAKSLGVSVRMIYNRLKKEKI